MRQRRPRQRGLAVVMALLLTTLAVTLVASLFWQQQVQIRALENQRLQMQTRWALQVGLDWARQILRDDALASSVDHAGEAWAAPMREVPLDEFLARDPGAADKGRAVLSASIVDAQARYNLANLAQNGIANAAQIAVFQRLLTFLKLDPALAEATAATIATTQTPAPPDKAGAPAGATQPATQAQLAHTVDLLSVAGFTVATLARVQECVVLLPGPTALNVNTAAPEVLAAQLNLSIAEAGKLVASRAQAYFRDAQEFERRAALSPAAGAISVGSDYFLVNGVVHLDRAALNLQALIYRKKTGNTTVKWVRSY